MLLVLVTKCTCCEHRIQDRVVKISLGSRFLRLSGVPVKEVLEVCFNVLM
jgi:hypothetical protein